MGCGAPGFKDAVEVRGRDLVSVVQVRRNEGPAGFFVEVICDDSAGGSQRRWWWDEATSDWYQARIRAHAGTSPGLTGPDIGAWRRAWALGDRDRRSRRRRRRWPKI